MDKHTRRWNLQQGGLFPARRRANLPPLHSSLLDSSLWGIENVSRILGMDRRRWWRTRRRWWGLRLLVWRNNKINRRHAKLVLTLCYPVAKFLLLSGCSSLDFLLLHDIFIFSSLFFPSFLTCQEITFEKLVSTLLTIFFHFFLAGYVYALGRGGRYVISLPFNRAIHCVYVDCRKKQKMVHFPNRLLPLMKHYWLEVSLTTPIACLSSYGIKKYNCT